MSSKSYTETRKVQKTGGSTLIVSLPKKWTEDTGLKAGSQIKLMNQPDGSLVINPSLDVSENIKDVKVLESSQEKSSHLFRSLIGIYLTGSTEIKVIGKPRLTVTQRKEIRKFSSYVIGFEIVEEEGNEVLLSDVSNPGALSFSILETLPKKSSENDMTLVPNLGDAKFTKLLILFFFTFIYYFTKNNSPY